jgi:hypothetical protein
LKAKDRILFEAANQWFDGKLRDIESQTKKHPNGEDYTPSGRKAKQAQLEKEFFGITLKEFKKNGYKIPDKKPGTETQ